MAVTAAILGMGPSIQDFKPGPDIITYGVNDIARLFQVDHHVIIDHLRVFNEERQSFIINSKAPAIYSHITDYRNIFQERFKYIEFTPGRGVLNFNTPFVLPKSNNSPYVAACLAFQQGARELRFYGVDLTNHPHIKNAKLTVALQNFEALFKWFRDRGVRCFVSSRHSLLHQYIPELRNDQE